MSKKLINLSNLQKFLLKLNEKFALKKAMKGITEDSEGNIIIGEEGLVPTPDENSKGKFLRSDGTWSTPGDSPLYETMSQEEGIEGVSEVDRVINAKTLKAVIEENENVVHKSGNETIDGTKTFSKGTWVTNNSTTAGYSVKNTAIARNEVPTQLYHATFRAYDKNDKILGEYCVEKSSTGCTLLNMNARSEDSNGNQLSESLYLNMSNDGSAVRFYPSSNNKVDLGMSNHKWAKVYSDDVVHTSGIETIEGVKKFTSDISRKDTAVDITTTPTSDMCSHVNFTDKNDKTVAYIQYAQKPNGLDHIGLRVRDKNSNTWGVQLNTNKEFAPFGNNSYSLGSSSYKWAKIYSDDVVHTSGNETINGAKTFTSTPFVSGGGATTGIYLKNTAIARNEVPSTTHYSVLRTLDKNDEILGDYVVMKTDKGATNAQINIRSEDSSGNQLINALNFSMANDNSSVSFAPSISNKVSLGSSSYKWAKVYSDDVVHTSGDETIAGNKTFSNKIKGNLQGNADTSTQFSANKSVTLTGDVTGTASSKGGWSVATTLANSGVTAGSYGPTANVTGNNNATISVPQITVDAKGRVTSVVNRTLTCKNNTYTVPTKVSQLTNDSKFVTLAALGSGDTNGMQETEAGSIMLCICNCSVLEQTSSSIQSNRNLQVPGSYLRPISWVESSSGLQRTASESSSYALPGTWRLLGNFITSSMSSKIYYVGLFMRVV